MWIEPLGIESKAACMLDLIVSDKVPVVSIIASDISGVIAPINFNLLIQWAFLNLYTRLWFTHTDLGLMFMLKSPKI